MPPQQTYIWTKDNIPLFCPPPWNAGWKGIEAASNGCGPQGWKIDLVPDTMYGCPVGEACRIHDVQYADGRTIEDKNSADRSFLNNLIRLIRARTTTWAAKTFLLKLRLHRAYVYYEAVSHFGGPAFWHGK
jgi:hypothetical protein